MKRIIIIAVLAIAAMSFAPPAGYKVGSKAEDFKLKNVDGNMVSLADFKDAKGFIVIFTCNHCPYSIMYEDRILALDAKYKTLGYPVIAINPNDASIVPDDSYEKMIVRSKEKGFTFPYLHDATQEVYREWGASRTPHVYIVQKEKKAFKVAYIGAIDDNYKDAKAVTKRYVENAVDALIAGQTPEVTFTKAIGCSIKDKSTIK
jgi:peroxiredoxin